ncbi:glycosyltransferase [Candidatus Woesebacteria bacterium]|nr:glycosyltransferase [Candidatus Woesebacteria bacterium]
MRDALKVAIVYDRVNKLGGAERVLLVLHEMFPDAPLYTSVYNSKTAKWAKVFPKVVTSFLQNIPLTKSRHDKLAIFMPLAFQSFNFDRYDLVVSVTSEAAKGIITRGKTKHICYCLTPTRYLWSGYGEYFKKDSLRDMVFRVVAIPFIKFLRIWDKKAAARPDKIIAISETVRERINKHYYRDSDVVYPPVKNLGSMKDETSGEGGKKPNYKLCTVKYYLVVSRLVPYKKVDLAIKTFNELGLPLYIVGTGSEEKSLKKMAKNNIKFLGQLTDGELASYYENCEALIFPQEEDFGLVAVEAQSFGKPVIAFNKGGASETVVDGKTGVLFGKQTIRSLSESIRRLTKISINAKVCKINAMRFSENKFKKEFLKKVEELI